MKILGISGPGCETVVSAWFRVWMCCIIVVECVDVNVWIIIMVQGVDVLYHSGGCGG